MRDTPRAPGLDGEGRSPLPHCCLLQSEFPNSRCGPLAQLPVSIMYVTEAEVPPHMQCLWFQVRNYGILGADVLCPAYYCKPLSKRPRALGPGYRACGQSGDAGLLEGLYDRFILGSTFHFHF